MTNTLTYQHAKCYCIPRLTNCRATNGILDSDSNKRIGSLANAYTKRTMTCTHNEWVYPPPRQMEQAYERGTYEDIGRFKCTQCGKVEYYTGHWRDFLEKGIPCFCFGSDRMEYWKAKKADTQPPASIANVVDLETSTTQTLLTTLHATVDTLYKSKFSGVYCITPTSMQPMVYRVHKMSVIPRIVESATISTTIQTVVDNLNNTDEYRDSFEWDAPSLWLTITK